MFMEKICIYIFINPNFFFQNFLSDFLEMLKWEFPTLMTTETIVIQVNYFNIIINKMNSLMTIHRENELKQNFEDDSIFRSVSKMF